MEGKSKLTSWASGLLLLAILLYPSEIYTVGVFLVGVACTLLVEAVFFYKYIYKYQSRPDLLPSVPPRLIPEPPVLSTPKHKDSMSESSRQQCICTSNKFDILAGAQDTVFQDLQAYLKGLGTIEKQQAAALSKISETPIMEIIRIKEFDDPYKSLKQSFKEISESHLKLANYTEKQLLPNITGLEKRLAKTNKELTKAFKEKSIPFQDAVQLIEQQFNKMRSLQAQNQREIKEYESAKTELCSYKKLAEKEMQIKLTSNDIMSLTHNIQQTRAILSKESDNYCDALQYILKEFKQINTEKAEQYRSVVQTWLATFESCLREDLSSIEGQETKETGEDSPNKFGRSQMTNSIIGIIKDSLPGEGDKLGIKRFLTKTFRKESNGLREQRSKLDEKLGNFQHYLNSLRRFIKKVSRTFKNYSNRFKDVILQTKSTSSIGFTEKWNQVNNGLYYLAELSEPFVDSLSMATEGIEELQRFQDQIVDMLNSGEDCPELMESVDESFGNLMNKREEFLLRSQEYLRQTLTKYLHDTMKAVSKLLSLLGNIDEDKDWEINQLATTHRHECPYFRIEEHEVSLNLEPESVPVGTPESANWLNSMLVTFFEEWTESEKFQFYICKRLRKIYNKDRPSFIGEIQVVKVDMGKQAPQMMNFTRLSSEDPLDFFHEMDLQFCGEIKIELEFEIKLVASVLVNIKVVVKSLFGRLQVFFTPSSKAKSWYSFLSEPAVKIGIEPVIGKVNKISFSEFPQINSFLVNILSRKIRKYVKPNTRSIKIPKGRRRVKANNV